MDSGAVKEGLVDDQTTSVLKIAVRSLYDAQKLRIETGNRIAAHVRDGVLDEVWAKRLEVDFKILEKFEMALEKEVDIALDSCDISPWLRAVRGVGPRMAGCLVSEIRDPGRFDTLSKLWAYSGLHTVIGPSGRQESPRRAKGQKANWNGFLRAKVVGVLGPSFLKSGSEYKKLYDDNKLRLESRPCTMSLERHNKKLAAPRDEAEEATEKVQKLLPNGCTRQHIHDRAIRYMVKLFLRDLYVEWRRIRGIPTRPTYAEEYLEKSHTV